MDEGLFLFLLFSAFVFFLSIIYCFLSTCLGLSIRRSDILEAFSLPTPSRIRQKDRDRQARNEARLRAGLGADDYELEDVPRGIGAGYDRLGGGMGMMGGGGSEEVEMMRRGGPSRGFF